MQRSAWTLLAALLALAGCEGPPPQPRDEVPSGAGAEKPLPPWDRVNLPPTVPAAKAALADDELVLGVVVRGKARAYRLYPFRFIAYHVVNDVVNKTAVTVTYCDRDDCLRAFTDDREEPLPIGLGGFSGGLLLRIGDRYFQQKTGRTDEGEEVPYRTMPIERTTWGAWKKAHPDTDVYIGKSSAPGSPPPADW